MPEALPTARRLTIFAAIVACFGLSMGTARGAELSLHGKAIYEKQCAMCHGENGVGVEDYFPDPLRGDLSISNLAEMIADTMPEDDPEACLGKDSLAVATYLHETFYRKPLPKSLRPQRVSLARLTKTQLRQSLADLYAYQGNTIPLAHAQGLKAMYFDGSKHKDGNLRIERVDAVLDFDFGHKGPGKKIDPQDFFIQWQGAIQADSTGPHEIVIRSSCAFVCYFGSYQRQFIDNHVQSGARTEFRRSLVLTAGRIYPLRIDFFQRKRKTEQPPAKISLSWKPPRGVEQIIPSRNLLKVEAPAAFSLQTHLPPDDRSYGYERGISVDRQWDESTTEAALEFAQVAADELWPLHQQKNRNKADRDRAQLRLFLSEIIATAFRGPLDEHDQKTYVDDPVDATEDDLEAILRSLLLTLKSPRFLYPGLDTDRSSSQRAASRLALTLFDSLPTDTWLFLQARGGELAEETQIRAAAERMLDDHRARNKVRELFHGWLNIENQIEITKNEEHFKDFNAELLADLRFSLETFIEEIVWSKSSDYRQLFLADWTLTTDRLANFYGDTWLPKAANTRGLQPSAGDPGKRFGVLTHPYLMSRMAYHTNTSPIHRGVFLTRYLLGRMLRPPQEAFAPIAAELHPDLTTRQRVVLQTGGRNCQVCHKRINGLGLTLENFDAVGRYRIVEREHPVDASGSYTTRDRKQIDFAGPEDLAELLAYGEDAHRTFIQRAFHHLVKQPVAAYGPDTMTYLLASFEQSNYNLRELFVEIAVIAASDSQKRVSNEQGDSDEK